MQLTLFILYSLCFITSLSAHRELSLKDSWFQPEYLRRPLLSSIPFIGIYLFIPIGIFQLINLDSVWRYVIPLPLAFFTFTFLGSTIIPMIVLPIYFIFSKKAEGHVVFRLFLSGLILFAVAQILFITSTDL